MTKKCWIINPKTDRKVLLVSVIACRVLIQGGEGKENLKRLSIRSHCQLTPDRRLNFVGIASLKNWLEWNINFIEAHLTANLLKFCNYVSSFVTILILSLFSLLNTVNCKESGVLTHQIMKWKYTWKWISLKQNPLEIALEILLNCLLLNFAHSKGISD